MAAKPFHSELASTSVFAFIVGVICLLQGCNRSGGGTSEVFSSGPCEHWCEGDRSVVENGEAHQVWHCGGQMSDMCGGCEYCGSSGGVSTSGQCEHWCEGDRFVVENGQAHEVWHCGGHMSAECGGCGYCSSGSGEGIGGGGSGGGSGTVGGGDGEMTSCASKVPLDSQSIWEAHDGPFQSCKTPHPYPQDGASMCAGDRTSFSLDLSTVADPVNCFVWTAPQCKFKWADVRALQFDVEWSECDGVWFAPLWANPSKWEHPQWRTGEIDFVETPPCPGVYSVGSTKVGTSFNCKYSSYAPPSQVSCADTTTGLSFGDGISSNGPRRFFLTLSNGVLETQICHLINGEAKQCTRSAYFANFLSETVAGRENLDMTFISDIWNGRTSDQQNCNGQSTHYHSNTQCKYAVWNIKVEGPSFSG